MTCDALDVRYWHKQTSPSALHMSAFRGKADMLVLHCTCPLLTQSGHRDDFLSGTEVMVAIPREQIIFNDFGVYAPKCTDVFYS